MASNSANQVADALLPDVDTEGQLNPQGEGESFSIVGVGASAGGLEAFTQLLKALPTDTGMSFVVVQHLAASHPSALAEILSRVTEMPVLEVHDEPAVEPNHVYVIPPARSMIIVGQKLELLPRESSVIHRPIDQFFRSLAQQQRHRAIGVVLSGTASDGAAGLEAIKAEGGITFAQDGTALHEGMPQSAIATGCVDFVLSPEEIAREIIRIGQHPYAATPRGSREKDNDSNFTKVVQLLQDSTGANFNHYKFNTLFRRITRRMLLQRLDGLAQYLELLRQTPAELEALYQDILISVTSFFRDPASFEALKGQVFPRLLKDRSPQDPIRVWTLGCSTGQEAYSLAMVFAEAAEVAESHVALQLFATDLNAVAIEKARAGFYAKDIAEDVSPGRLRRFFTAVDGSYRIAKSIRDMCVFSRHNVLADPPFSRMDLISCRNLLIYMESATQRRIVPTLHYALKPSGFLWLGNSEAIGAYRHLFEVADAKHKIYAKKPGSVPGFGQFALKREGVTRPSFTQIAARRGDTTAELPREADRLLSTRFAPPGVIVSADMDILQYRGDTGAYLAPAPGKASLSLLKMLREGLLVAVRSAILRAGKDGKAAREEGLRVKSNGGYRDVTIEVIPLKGQAAGEGGFLLLFEETGQRPGKSSDEFEGTHRAPPIPEADDATIRLTQELASTREYLQSVIEQQEAVNEELQSANEEVQSANEELQSTNEELETSKEEIQSSNEELVTVNDELNNRNAELNRVNNDLVNLIGSVQVPIVMLGPDLRIRRFTPAAEKLLSLVPTDIGRSIGDIKLSLDDVPDIESQMLEVLDTVSTKERDVRDRHGRWHSLRLRPYKTLDNKIDGVVMALFDIDPLKRAQEYAESIVSTVREPLLVLDNDLRVKTASRSFYEMFRATPEETENRLLHELDNRVWDIPDLRRLLAEILPRSNQVTDYVAKGEFEHIGTRTMMLNARRLIQAADQSPLILLAIEDITRSENAKSALRESEQRFRALFELGPVAVYTCDASGVIQLFNSRAVELWGREPNPGDTDEKFCGSLRLCRPDGSILPHEQCPMAEVLTGSIPEARDAEVVIERPDGSRITVLVNIRPLVSERGEITGAMNCFYDITERKHAEELLRASEQRLASMIYSSHDAIITKSLDGIIQSWNPAAERLFGYTADEVVGRPISVIIPADRAEEEERIIASLRAGEPVEHFESVRVRSDGQTVQVSLTISPIRDQTGRIIGASKIARDITHQKRLEAKLLEDDRRKNEFLAMLAHELRNPLAPIHNSVQILRLKSADAEAVASASDMMERQVGQMIRLVDDLLDVNRITQGKIELRRGRIELASAVNHAVEAARSLYANHKLLVTLPEQAIYLDADPTRLAQVVGNLLTNACKFSEKGSGILLTVAREGAQAVVCVRDTGIGIAAEQLPRIFDMFMQVDTSLERSVSGLGIGLTLVKNLVEMHGGTVEAQSAGLGHGSEFVVRLPALDGSTAAPPEPKIDEPTKMPARRILIVDDNRDAANSLAMLLKLTGNETHTAFDGLEAAEAAADLRPEVVLLDIGLPNLNGYEVCRRIRGQPGGKGILMVALTGWGQEEDRQKCRDAGFDAHLVKPVELPALMKLLANFQSAPT